ncbi:MAG: mismatch repair protein MutL [Acidobacteria bacterium]|jgi:DNA mismatch repair protein MutL|nr:mismatch repair protein MutL [Acidobacteriota bacterium]
MNKIKVLSDNLANQIAAGEVVERPASVIKELVENSIDAGAKRIQIDIELGGRRLMRVVDDGEGMARDDAILAFERHATSKIKTLDDLSAILTLGFRGEALASIASVAKIELVTKTFDDSNATRVYIEGGKLFDVKDAARSAGTTICVRDLFFNTPARRKFMRSEATENYHITSIVTHYALAHHDIAFTLTNNGRELLRVSPSKNLRERAYQIFGGNLIESLLPVAGGRHYVASVSGFISAPRERRTTRDAQYFFVNRRFVRDKVIAGGLIEGFRSVLPHGVYPVAFLFLDIPHDEIDVNVHPAKTEIRFRRGEAVKEVIAESVRQALSDAGILRDRNVVANTGQENPILFNEKTERDEKKYEQAKIDFQVISETLEKDYAPEAAGTENFIVVENTENAAAAIETVELYSENGEIPVENSIITGRSIINDSLINDSLPAARFEGANFNTGSTPQTMEVFKGEQENLSIQQVNSEVFISAPIKQNALPPFDSAEKLVKRAEVSAVSASKIRPLGQLHNSFIIATDDEGLLLIDQHVAHERILFDKYRKKETERLIESQNLLLPETFDLTPAQSAAFSLVADELESLGFDVMRLSGRTIAIKAVPTDLPASEIRNLLAEILDSVDSHKRGNAKSTMRDEIAASLACKAAVKINMKLTPEKMQWLIDRLLYTSSPTTCPHGRPVILRLTMRDIERGFHRT